MNELKYRLFASVSHDLQAVESALHENLNPFLDIVSKVAEHILFSGGKRLRPLLMILCARLCGYSGRYDKTLSTVFEYLHAATLLHDDIVDGADLRRGKPVAHAIWGSAAAVLVGDFLLARCLTIAAETENPDVVRVIAEITENMSQGEIHQLVKKRDLNLSESEYLEVIRRKTAVLIQGACRIGALIADAPAHRCQALADYGLSIGIAFQMADDLLDYVADVKNLGKNVGADLREGKLTLPVIFALKQADAPDRAEMERILQADSISDKDFESFKDFLHKYKGISYTKELANRHVQNAKSFLSVFEPSDTRQLLMEIADYALARKE